MFFVLVFALLLVHVLAFVHVRFWLCDNQDGRGWNTCRQQPAGSSIHITMSLRICICNFIFICICICVCVCVCVFIGIPVSSNWLAVAYSLQENITHLLVFSVWCLLVASLVVVVVVFYISNKQLFAHKSPSQFTSTDRKNYFQHIFTQDVKRSKSM